MTWKDIDKIDYIIYNNDVYQWGYYTLLAKVPLLKIL